MALTKSQQAIADSLQTTVDEKAKAAVTDQISQAKAAFLTQFNIKALDLKSVGGLLREHVRDDAIAVFDEIKKGDPAAKTPSAQVDQRTHRYTIDVPDTAEQTVLNLGHGDPKRYLDDDGISARTNSQIQLHAKNKDVGTMVVLGGKITADHAEIVDHKSAITNNQGLSAITNGLLWAESQKDMNLASVTGQTTLRSYAGMTRVQAKMNVEVGADEKVIIGAKNSVAIVAEPSVDASDRDYGKQFTGKFADTAKWQIIKDGVSISDIVASVTSAILPVLKQETSYKAGENARKDKKTEWPKTVADWGKVASSLYRLVDAKDSAGKVSISADNYASVTGHIGTSIYGRFSASLASLVSASIIGGTASMKGIAWTSIWGGNGVSVRSLTGSASLKSDFGKASVSAKGEVNISSEDCVVIGGDKGAELKSLKGPVFLSGPGIGIGAGTKDTGMGVLMTSTGVMFGGVSNPGKRAMQNNKTTRVNVDSKKEEISLNTPNGNKVHMKSDGVHIHGEKAWIC
jgi:hypothetical protein